MNQEFQLLLHCSTSQPNASLIRNVVDEGVNWGKLLELAEQHGVRPMLRRSLHAVCWDSAPQTVQCELERFNRANVQRSLCFAGELSRLHAEFQQNRIPLAAFKGVALAELVYGDISLRETSDLDVIVHETDLAK